MSMSKYVDAVVVGAGPSGAVVASELIKAGFRVTCLEQGRWIRRSEFRGATKDWELSGQKDWHPNPNVRGNRHDYPIDVSESDLNVLMFGAVGGSSILYGGAWSRALPSDFRVRTLDGVADDWPLSYEDLAPHYDALDKEMGVAGLGGDPSYPEGAPPPLPPLPIGRIGLTAARGMDSLGWHWWPGPNVIASRAYRGREVCVRRGTCQTGCPEGAKGSFDLTHWPSNIERGVELITEARVAEVPLNENGLARGVVYIDRSGRRTFLESGIVILAANSIGTPRILLMSESKRFPRGLANSSGLVGTNLMMHPYAAVVGVYPENLESWLGPAGQSIVSTHFYETDKSRGFVRGAKWLVMPSGGPLGHRSGYAGRPDDDASNEGIPGWGSEFHRQTRERFGRSFEWGIVAEDLPDPGNRLTLSSSLVDSDGLPSPKVYYKTSQNTIDLLAFHVARAREAHWAAGAIEVYDTPLMRDSGWHLVGTARMGRDPSSSVVDPFGRTHDVDNLFIMDGSVFVTSTGVNPTATITALARRSAQELVRRRREQQVAK